MTFIGTENGNGEQGSNFKSSCLCSRSNYVQEGGGINPYPSVRGEKQYLRKLYLQAVIEKKILTYFANIVTCYLLN